MLSHFLMNCIKNKAKSPTLQVCLLLKIKKRDGRVCERASITIEAALVLPIIISILVFLITPLKIMDINRRIQYISEVASREAAEYAYGIFYKNIIDSTNKNMILNLSSDLALSEFVKYKINKSIKEDKIINLNTYETECMRDGENIVIRVSYAYKMPFDILGLYKIEQNIISYRRAWIGNIKNIDDNEEDTLKEEYVYVGNNMSRYHLDSKCHYLFNNLISVYYRDVDKLRNKNGGKYEACARCGNNINNGIVYILQNGKAYHSNPECTAIISYVRRVKKREVEYLGACQYCGKISK